MKDLRLWHSERSKQSPMRSLSMPKYELLGFELGEIGSIDLINNEDAKIKNGKLIRVEQQLFLKYLT